MQTSRLVLSAIASVAVLWPASPSAASTSRRLLQLDHRPGGRDTVRVLGDGGAVRFVQLDDRLHAATAIGSEAPQRYLVTFAEPAPASATPADGHDAFAARVRSRQELARRFETELGRRAARFDARGRAAPRVLATWDRLLAGAVVLAPPHAEAALRAIPGVRAVSADVAVKTNALENLAQVRADRVQQELGGTGSGVRVGIIDTGVDHTHPALGAGFGPSFRVAGGWDFVHGDADPRDDNGHGTHVAGIVAGSGGGIVGMAPEARLYAYKVLDANGGGWLSDVILGLERCADPDQDPGTDDALDAVNLSLGGFGSSDEDPATEAVDALDALGTIVVVAAGNFGIEFGVGSPGIARGAITVGSVGSNDSLSTFSSRGPTIGLRIKPDVLAPGESIASSWLDGGNAWLSGTSMATPHVTGAAALLRQLHPEWSHAEIRSALVATAHDLRRPAAQQGSGRLDAWAAATATLFVAPTNLSFGRVRPELGWERAETLQVHSRAAGVAEVALSLDVATAPAWLELSLTPDHLRLEPGVEALVILRMRSIAAHPVLADPPFVVEGALRFQTSSEGCRVPFSIHEALQVQLASETGPPTGVLIGRGRPWPPLAFGATWLLQPGSYDILAFGDFRRPNEPFVGITDAAIASDTVIAVSRSTATSDLTWDLRDEHAAPHMPRSMALRLLHESGGGLGYSGLRDQSVFTFPVMKPGYRLEWWALDEEGAERYDIPGVERAPFTDHVVQNDPSALRRLVEHVHVPEPDSLLLLEFPLHSDGDGWFGLASLDPFQVPYGRSFDVVRWTAPVPSLRHLRYGRTTYSLDPAKTRAFAPDPYNGFSPVWDQRHGDTLMVVPRNTIGPPLARFTGRDMPFGSGAALPDALFQLSQDQVEILPQGYVPQLFHDGAGSRPAGAPSTYEFRDGATVLGSGTLDPQSLMSGRWQLPRPGRNSFDVVLRSNGWTVLGRPSTTTVTVRFDALGACPSPAWFSILAGGGPVERIAFGQQRDPHVEMRFAYLPDDVPLAIECRAGESGEWTPLVVERRDGNVRATIPPLLGDIAMRVRIGAVPTYYPPMTIEIVPAFVGAPSSAANAQVLQAEAGPGGAHLEWRVDAPGDVLPVERFDANAGWQEWGEVVVQPDGIARYDDRAVVPGGRYGYRLGGMNTAVYLEIPAAAAGLALAIRSNPSSDGLVAAVTLDRDAPVTIRVHDVQGRLVASRTWTGLAPGVHVLPVLARGRVKTGLYFVRLEREGETRDRRVTILQ